MPKKPEPKNFRCWSRSLKLGFQFKKKECLADELYRQNKFSFYRTKSFRSRSHRLLELGAGNLISGSTTLVEGFRVSISGQHAEKFLPIFIILNLTFEADGPHCYFIRCLHWHLVQNVSLVFWLLLLFHWHSTCLWNHIRMVVKGAKQSYHCSYSTLA